MRATAYRNVMLTAIAGLLGLIAMQNFGVPGAAPAYAGPETESASPSSGLANPADQRRQMIAELKGIAQRLERLDSRMQSLEGKINNGLKVRVIEMPASKKSDEPAP